MRVRLLHGQVFSYFGELWLAVSHGGGIAGGTRRLPARLGGQSELGAAASRKAVSWDLRLASLLTHLLWTPYV